MRWPARWRPQWTMQNQLLLVALLITLLAWVAGIVLTLAATKTAMERLHDRELVEVATLLHGLAGPELLEHGEGSALSDRIKAVRADTQATLRTDYRYQVWTIDGRLLLANFGLASAAPMARFGSTALSWIEMDGERWRVYAHRSVRLNQEVHVAERASMREIAFNVFDPSFLLLVALSLAAAIGPALGLSRLLMLPLQELVRGLAQRSPTRLEPLQVQHAPVDIQPVVSSMNRLFQRVGEALQREAAFTALAAHELRTPLATLRLLAKSAQAAGSEAERQQTLDELVRSADRCAHLQEQLLTLSRLDTQGVVDGGEEVDLTEVIVDVLSGLLPQAREHRIKLASRLDGSAITGHRFGVLTLVRNLVANAVRYTPEGGRVEVHTASRNGSAFVTVDDSGPGIPAAERERVFERFVRLQREQAPGVGLGLSIVRTVAAMHGSVVTLGDSPLGGLRVTVEFRGRALARELLEDFENLA
ncbi:Sensory histidine kinase QseC [Rubrivivax sp. A210]|uniref:ATP-binding protein n=1 Tax=Rubrivivax sp. A210 TaxID=2772301 RepID=UPI00191AF28E|nr:ATP-binding protein [Rubrivivax sp. A210]CAD5373353.1 Sensory histidine kinase QseC [Rubrivivax sp. A210]